MNSQPKVGELVRYTGAFLRSIGMYSGAPINGRVQSVGHTLGAKECAMILWCNAEDATLVPLGVLEYDPAHKGKRFTEYGTEMTS